MIQLILAVVMTVSVVIFGMVNTHHVALFYLLGAPVQIRLITLLAMAFAGGVVSTLLYQLFGKVVQRARLRDWQLVADEEID